MAKIDKWNTIDKPLYRANRLCLTRADLCQHFTEEPLDTFKHMEIRKH